MSLNDLPYGTIIEYRKKRYFKCQGAEGDIMFAEKEHGMWHFIKDGGYKGDWQTVDWKKFHVLYLPPDSPMAKHDD
jgi:hypothetical protein